MKKLNLGSGPDVRDGWENYDRDEYEGVTVGDIKDGLPWGDGTFDIVVANHFLQMMKYVDLPTTLTEIRRVLTHKGVVRILVPDLLSAVSAYRHGHLDWFPIVNEAETTTGGKLCAYVSWYSEANLVFTPAWLAELLQRNGFEPAVVTCGFSAFGPPEIVELDSRPTESLVVEGRKR